MIRRATSKSLCCLLMVLFCFFITAGPVGAEGDGSGGGQNVPLGLASSTPANGAQNVALDVKIKLLFNKNVINMTVRENNQRCFSLYTGNTNVPIEVQMADDQIYPELKREVNLLPRQALKPGAEYTVVVSHALQAKNGAVLGQDAQVKFSTAGAQAPTIPAAGGEGKKVVPPSTAINPDNTAQPESKAMPSKPDIKSGTQSQIRAETSTKPLDSTNAAPTPSREKKTGIWLAGIAAIVLLGAGYWYVRRR